MKLIFKETLPFPPSVNDYWHKSVVKNKNANAQNVQSNFNWGSKAGKNKQHKVKVYLSKKAIAFHSAVADIISKKGSIRTCKGDLIAEVILYPKDNRRRDIDNPCKALFDSLVKTRVIADDSQIKQVIITMGEIFKGGACDIKLYEVDNFQKPRKGI